MIFTKALIAITLVAILAACGGGGGEANTPVPAAPNMPSPTPEPSEIPDHSLAWPADISRAFPNCRSLDVSGVITALYAARFGDGGGKVYFQNINGEIAQFSLGVPWDIASAIVHDGSFIVSAGETLLRSFFLSSDGRMLFTLSEDSRTIYQYTLSTAWDITSAVFDGVSMNTGVPFLRELRFSSDGSRLYVHNILDIVTYQFDLVRPWDISEFTAAGSINLEQYMTSTESRGFYIDPEGRYLYINGTDDVIHQFSLAVPGDVTSAVYDLRSYDAHSTLADSTSILFREDSGQVFWVLAYGAGSEASPIAGLYEFNFNAGSAAPAITGFDITGTSADDASGSAPISPTVNSGGFVMLTTLNDSVGQRGLSAHVSSDAALSQDDVAFHSGPHGESLDCFFNNANELYCGGRPEQPTVLSSFLNVIPKDAFIIIEVCDESGELCVSASHPVRFQ